MSVFSVHGSLFGFNSQSANKYRFIRNIASNVFDNPLQIEGKVTNPSAVQALSILYLYKGRFSLMK